MARENSVPVALVTGGSEGIGYACARLLGRRGYQVCLASRNSEKLEQAHCTLLQEEIHVALFPMDVGNDAQVREGIAALVEQFGGIDVLINAAGCSMPAFCPMGQIRDEDYRRIMRANADGVFFVSRAVLPVMQKQDRGYILNILSTAAHGAAVGNAPYSASKHAALAVTKTMEQECRGTGVRVSSLSPGPVATTIWSHKEAPPSRETMDKMLRPEEVAEVALFLIEQPPNVHLGDTVVTPWYF